MKKWNLFLLLLIHALVCGQSADLPIHLLQVPSGFQINLLVKVPGARSLTLGNLGTIFVGTRDEGKVYALVPQQNNIKIKQVLTIANGLDTPNGVAFYRGDLYVAEKSRILRYQDIEHHLLNPPAPQVIVDHLPNQAGHDWRYIKFGPDGWLYISIGVPCNVCLSEDPRFGTILRMHPDGTDQQIFAKGIRNSVGFAWHPTTKELWFTDNGRDWLGDSLPPDKLNVAPKAGLDFGFPYYHARNLPDPKFGKLRSPVGIHFPVQELGPHVAALGMIFYQGKMFPPEYHQQIIIAEHGSWNRSQKIGYRVTWVRVKDNHALSYQPLVTGWLQDQHAWGRPVDLLELRDGSVLISDDEAGAIYRLSYKQ